LKYRKNKITLCNREILTYSHVELNENNATCTRRSGSFQYLINVFPPSLK
jgi:hypothetical protein